MMNLRCAIAAGALFLLAPPALAQQAAGDDFKGRGAAGCVAAGELLAGQPGADARIGDAVLAWRQILHVMEGTDEQRRTALERARASFTQPSDGQPGLPKAAAEALWATMCAQRDMQVQYAAVLGSADRLQLRLADEPGTELSAEAVGRLNVSASCLVAAELFSRPRPSGRLRAALREATPRSPDAGVLREIQERSRREVDAAPGSAAGKALMVDYLRYLYTGATSGSNAQSFVNRTSQVLQDRCQPAAGSTPNP
jgi:hypothetical protein